MKKYRIIRLEKSNKVLFKPQMQHSFFGFKYWSTLQWTQDYFGEGYDYDYEFDNVDDAITVIHEYQKRKRTDKVVVYTTIK